MQPVPSISSTVLRERQRELRAESHAERWRVFIPTVLMVLYTGLGIAECIYAPSSVVAETLLLWGVIAAAATLLSAVRVCRVRPLADEEAVYLAMSLGMLFLAGMAGALFLLGVAS
jgi:hypothetical protein